MINWAQKITLGPLGPLGHPASCNAAPLSSPHKVMASHRKAKRVTSAKGHYTTQTQPLAAQACHGGRSVRPHLTGVGDENDDDRAAGGASFNLIDKKSFQRPSALKPIHPLAPILPILQTAAPKITFGERWQMFGLGFHDTHCDRLYLQSSFPSLPSQFAQFLFHPSSGISLWQRWRTSESFPSFAAAIFGPAALNQFWPGTSGIDMEAVGRSWHPCKEKCQKIGKDVYTV